MRTIFVVFSLLLTTETLFAKATKLALSWESLPLQLDPRYGMEFNAQQLAKLTHCRLFTTDEKAQLKQDVASKSGWTDNTHFWVEISLDHKFSDGKPVSLEDVKASYDFYLDPKVSPPSPLAQNVQKTLESVKISKNQLVFTLKAPDAGFVIDTMLLAIYPKADASKVSTGDIMKDLPAATCGPFILVEKNLNSLVLKANKTAFNKPKLESLEIKIIKEEGTRHAKLMAGEIQFVQNGFNGDKLEKFETDPKFKLLRTTSLKTNFIGFNFKDPILKNQLVRQALSKAMDREIIKKVVYKNYAQLARTILTPESEYFEKSLSQVKQDLKEAEKLLDQAGFPQKSAHEPRLVLSIKTSQDEKSVTVAKAIVGQWNKIGVKVDLQSLEWGRFMEDIKAGKVQMWIANWMGFKDPSIYEFAFSTDSAPPKGYTNRGGYSNQEVDALLAEGKKEIDLTKRKAIFSKVQLLLEKEMPYIYLFHEDHVVIVAKEFSGYKVSVDGSYEGLIELEGN